MVEPQVVGVGKPKTGVLEPSGIGAGVVWRVASLAARERPEPFFGEVDDDEELEERSRNSVTRK